MNDLHIFDVYGYLHTVSEIERYNREVRRCMPVGGMKFLLRKITAELLIGNKVVCCLDNKVPKGTRLSGYKKNRKLSPEIVAQADYLYNMLQRCGIPSYRGFAEADSFIANICDQYAPLLEYGSNIYINGCDYDLCHNVSVWPKGEVQFKTINTNCCDVSWNNFSIVLFDKDTKERIIWNTISAYKVFCGDTSDCIKRFTLSDGTKGIDLYRDFKEMLKTQLSGKSGKLIGDRRVLEYYINTVKGITDVRDLKLLKERMDTIYPKDLRSQYPNGFDVADRSKVDVQLLADYCHVIGDRDSLISIKKMGKIPHSGDDLKILEDELFRFGVDFSDGKFMVDNNLPMASMVRSAESINVFKEF